MEHEALQVIRLSESFMNQMVQRVQWFKRLHFSYHYYKRSAPTPAQTNTNPGMPIPSIKSCAVYIQVGPWEPGSVNCWHYKYRYHKGARAPGSRCVAVFWCSCVPVVPSCDEGESADILLDVSIQDSPERPCGLMVIFSFREPGLHPQPIVLSSRINYCNGLFIGTNHNIISRLQLVQNAAARTLTWVKRREHIPLVLSSLHWLPVSFRIDFKVLLTCKALDGLAPPYHKDLLEPNVPNCPLQ
ncbi:UNVERIFIED_CONTAM: hypothetical protein FKN15_068711 [Acipenser sinensis]